MTMDSEIRQMQKMLRRSGTDVICLPREIAERLVGKITHLLWCWRHTANGDEEAYCSFCQRGVDVYNREFTYGPADIVHAENCQGKEILLALETALKHVT